MTVAGTDIVAAAAELTSSKVGGWPPTSIAGLVVSLKVKEGDEIKAGQELMVIEAMKMENVIYADRDTSVKKILVADRESIAVDQVLMQFAA